MSARRTAMSMAMLLLLALGCGGGTPAPEPVAASGPAAGADATARLEWERGWDAAFLRAEAEEKAVLIDFYADWCVWCKKLDTTTYRDAEVVELVNSELVPLKVDVDGDGRSRARKWGVSGLPTILVVDPDGRELGRIPGYLPPTEFRDRLARILS